MAIAAEAATFALASAVHFVTGFTDAAIPELVIAAVLGAGSSAILTQRAHARGIATGTAAIAIPVFLLGARRPVRGACGAGVMVAPCGRALVCLCWLGAQPRAGLRGWRGHLPGRRRIGRAATPRGTAPR